MKGAGSKAISSPSRGGGAENYPPPFIMRFLRSNVGSKSSRGGGSRSRSSPMFVVRKKNVAGTIETQEPSSPKVTCIGQVRVGRSKNSTPSKPGQSQGTCTCFPGIKCSLCTPRKPNWRKLASFFRFGCCKKCDVISNESDSNNMNHFNVDETELSLRGIGGGKEEEAREEVSRGSTTPPKNALLLTRCRSAPFRPSSLAVQLWGENSIGDQVNEASYCYRGFDQRENQAKKQLSTKFRHYKEEESQEISSENLEIISMPHPLILTRCRSESEAAKSGYQAKP